LDGILRYWGILYWPFFLGVFPLAIFPYAIMQDHKIGLARLAMRLTWYGEGTGKPFAKHELGGQKARQVNPSAQSVGFAFKRIGASHGIREDIGIHKLRVLEKSCMQHNGAMKICLRCIQFLFGETNKNCKFYFFTIGL
jgi:hypothetical protein